MTQSADRTDCIEQELACIRRMKDGDVGGLEPLYRCYSVRLYRAVLRCGLPPQIAEEVIHDTFTRVWHQIDRYQPRGASVYGWIKTIGTNLARDRHRRRKNIVVLHPKGTPADNRASSSAPVQDLLELEQKQRVNATIDLLPERYAAVIRMRMIEDLSPGEVATRLDTTPNNVNVRLHRACLAFHDLWTQETSHD